MLFFLLGQLLSGCRTLDGKPIFPGKHKEFRLDQGAVVRAGNTLCFQKRLEYHPGLYVSNFRRPIWILINYNLKVNWHLNSAIKDIYITCCLKYLVDSLNSTTNQPSTCPHRAQ